MFLDTRGSQSGLGTRPKGSISTYEQMEILELLGNPQMRCKLWDLYFGYSKRPADHYLMESKSLCSVWKGMSALRSTINPDWSCTLRRLDTQGGNATSSKPNRHFRLTSSLRGQIVSQTPKRRQIFGPAKHRSCQLFKHCFAPDTVDYSSLMDECRSVVTNRHTSASCMDLCNPGTVLCPQGDDEDEIQAIDDTLLLINK